MTRYRVSVFAAGLAALLLTDTQIADQVAGMHPDMRAEGERVLRDQDTARRLMLGVEPFADAWALSGGPYDPSQADVIADELVSSCKVTGLAPFPAADTHARIRQLAELDPGHPFVAHRDVLRRACRGMHQDEHDWSDIDAFVAAKRAFDTGPAVGQACDFYPADGSPARDGIVTLVWGATMVNLAFVDNGAPALASSVQILRQPDQDQRYYAVLRAAA